MSFLYHKQIYTACKTLTQLIHSKNASKIGSCNKNYYSKNCFNLFDIVRKQKQNKTFLGRLFFESRRHLQVFIQWKRLFKFFLYHLEKVFIAFNRSNETFFWEWIIIRNLNSYLLIITSTNIKTSSIGTLNGKLLSSRLCAHLWLSRN